MTIVKRLAVLPALLLAACAVEPKRIEAPPETRIIVQPARPSEAEQLLSYMARMRKLEARELAIERENSRGLFLQDRRDVNRLKYALILMLAQGSTPPLAGAQDDAEILNLIEPLVLAGNGGAATGEPEVRVLASLLYGALYERRKLRDQLRDTQARLNNAKKDDIRDAEARALRHRVEELEAKLNALKSIDRSVNRRAESQPK